jgi:hypothetical protein
MIFFVCIALAKVATKGIFTGREARCNLSLARKKI